MQSRSSNLKLRDNAICESLIISVDQQDAVSILDQIKMNLNAFYITFSLIRNLVASSSTDDCEKLFIVKLLTHLVKEFGIPSVVEVESEEFCEFFASLLNTEMVQELNSLLTACLQQFNTESQREAVPHLLGLYKSLAKGALFPSAEKTKNNKEFLELFTNIQQVLSFQKAYDCTEQSKTVLAMLIKTVVEQSNFENASFSVLEKDLLEKYKKELLKVLEALEKEKEDLKRAKQIKEQQKETLRALPKERQLSNRVSFVQGEDLLFEESEELEYKDYNFPFTETLEKTLSRTICSFLNRNGGRIYIGVTDDKIVKGISLTRQEKEEFEQTISRCVSTFEPEINGKELVTINYLPVMANTQTRMVIPGLFVVKLIVKQGETNYIYSVTKDVLQCYIRGEGQSKLLSAAETRDAIIENFLHPRTKMSVEDFTDPEPAQIIDIEERYSLTRRTTKDRKKGGSGGLDHISSEKNEICTARDSPTDLTIEAHSSFKLSIKGRKTRGNSNASSGSPDSICSGGNEVGFSVTTYSSKCDLDQIETGRGSVKGKSRYAPEETEAEESQLPPPRISINNRHVKGNSSGDFQGKVPRNSSGRVSVKENNNKKCERISLDAKKKCQKQGEQKEYYSSLLETTVSSLQSNGKNMVQVYEVFVEGLPLTWTQDNFDKFLENLGCKSIFSSRMFKKDTGFCNGKSFLNFTDQEEAKRFVDTYNGSSTFGKPLMAKFK